ncbi:MAG TPA: metallophosphoesterase family protein [Bryobacteraceae bacterium]|nr:metallophosphoesterase family protein [Bryobacteraceae bacterium]
MPYLILSDVHGNREALEAVMEDAQDRYDRLLCLGDLVGYGADPNYVTTWAKTHASTAIRGNHDRICAGLESLEAYHPAARASAEWTRRALSEASSAHLRNLPGGPLRAGAEESRRVFDDFDLVHGSPADEDEYLVDTGDIAPIRERLDAQLTFFGHTHIQGGFLLTRGGIRRIAPAAASAEIELEPDHYYLINPGSVGQPRDRDPRAAYAIYTPEDRTVQFRRARYDIDAAAGKILQAGLPPLLAARLYEGT